MALPKFEDQEHEAMRLESVEGNAKNFLFLLKVNTSDGRKEANTHLPP